MNRRLLAATADHLDITPAAIGLEPHLVDLRYRRQHRFANCLCDFRTIDRQATRGVLRVFRIERHTPQIRCFL